MAAPSFIVTLLGTAIPQRAVDACLHALDAHGLTGGTISRLDEELPATGGADRLEALEIAFATSRAPDLAALKKSVARISLDHRLDIAFQNRAPGRRRPRLAVFDMDSTLIQAEVIDEFAREMGRYDEVACITEEAMRGNLVFEESLARRVALLKGLNVSRIDAVYSRIRLAPGAEELLRALRRLGCRTAILSGGFLDIATRLQSRLGIDEVHANRLEMENGVCTGRTIPPVVDAHAKARIFAEIAARHGIAMSDTIAVGDGANDLLMLAEAGLGVAFNAKPIVAEQASFSLRDKPLSAILYLMGLKWDEIRKLTAPGAA